jgi:hypothetical protein
VGVVAVGVVVVGVVVGVVAAVEVASRVLVGVAVIPTIGKRRDDEDR